MVIAYVIRSTEKQTNVQKNNFNQKLVYIIKTQRQNVNTTIKMHKPFIQISSTQ